MYNIVSQTFDHLCCSIIYTSCYEKSFKKYFSCEKILNVYINVAFNY